MELKEEINETIETALRQAVDYLKLELPELPIADLFMRLEQTNDTLSIFDDEEHLLTSVSLMIHQDDYHAFKKEFERCARHILQRWMKAGEFDELNILKPFSVILVDDNYSSLVELITIDEQLLVLNEEDLSNWEKDFDFLMENLSFEE